MKKEALLNIWPLVLYAITALVIYLPRETMVIFGSGLWSFDFQIFWHFILLITFVSLLLQTKYKHITYLCMILLALETTAPIYNAEVYSFMLMLGVKYSAAASYISKISLFIIVMSIIAAGVIKKPIIAIAYLIIAIITISPIAYTQAKRYELQANSNKAPQPTPKIGAAEL